jgi:hypothetical protein
MPQVASDASALASALELLRTPRALDVLEDLARDRSPNHRCDDQSIIDEAIAYLRRIGAVADRGSGMEAANSALLITPQGRKLFQRLQEIEKSAARQHRG